MSNQQKSVLVTGASSGIGYQLALDFAQKGYKVFAGARRIELMEPLKDKGIITLQLDVSSTESILNAKEQIIKETGGSLNILYNNAGLPHVGSIFDMNKEESKRVFDVNVFGPMELIKVFQKPLMLAKGTVVFTGSAMMYAPAPFSATYTASKAAISHVAKVLFLETEKLGLKVIEVVTGIIETPMSDPVDVDKIVPEDSIYYLENDNVIKTYNMARTPVDVYSKEVISKIEYAIENNISYTKVCCGSQAGLGWYVNTFLSFNTYKKVLFNFFLKVDEPMSKVSANLDQRLEA